MTHTGSGGSASGTSVREDALVARLSALAPALDGEPDPEWQARTRTRLVAMAAVRTPEPAPVPPLRRLFSRAEETSSAWRTRLTAGLAGAAAAVTGLAAVVALSADASPGDPLYTVKRGTEQTQLALAGDARGRTLLGFATTRLEELTVVLEGDPSTGLVQDTLATMDAQTLDGAAWLAQRAVDTGGSASLDDLSGWSSGQSAALGDLLPDLPSGAQAEAAASAELLDRIDERAAELRTALACSGGPATSGTDELGPVPAACAPAPRNPTDAGEPDAPPTGGPGASGAPAPSAPPPSGGTAGSGSGSGSGSGTRTDGEPSSGPSTGSGTDVVPQPPVTGVPTPDLPTPSLPSLDLPTLFPNPDRDGAVRPPLEGSQAPATGLPGPLDDLACELTSVLPDC